MLMKIKLKVKRVKENRQEEGSGRQQMKLCKLKDEKVKREYQAVIAELYEGARGTDIEMA